MNKFLADEHRTLLKLPKAFGNCKHNSSFPVGRHISQVCMEPFEKWQVATCCFSKSFVQIGEICQPIKRKGYIKNPKRIVHTCIGQRVDVQRVSSSPLNIQLCSISMRVCVCASCVIKNCIEPFKTGIWDSPDRGNIPMGEAMRAPRNIHLMRVGLVISVD
jgi:hypothetical protein